MLDRETYEICWGCPYILTKGPRAIRSPVPEGFNILRFPLSMGYKYEGRFVRKPGDGSSISLQPSCGLAVCSEDFIRLRSSKDSNSGRD